MNKNSHIKPENNKIIKNGILAQTCYNTVTPKILNNLNQTNQQKINTL